MAMTPKQKLAILGGGGVIGLFVLLTFAQNWGQATAQRDVKHAENAVKACLANPKAAAKQCVYATKEIGAAIPEMDPATQQPEILKAHQQLAQLLMATGAYREAAKSYVKVAAATPQQSPPYRDVALAYSLGGEHRAAVHYATLSVQLAPTSWKSLQMLGRVQYRAEMPKEALESFKKALTTAPIEEKPGLENAILKIQSKLTPSATAQPTNPSPQPEGAAPLQPPSQASLPVVVNAATVKETP